MLEGDADTTGLIGDRLPLQQAASLRRGRQAAEEPCERRFARAVRAGDDYPLSSPDLEVDPAQGSVLPRCAGGVDVADAGERDKGRPRPREEGWSLDVSCGLLLASGKDAVAGDGLWRHERAAPVAADPAWGGGDGQGPRTAPAGRGQQQAVVGALCLFEAVGDVDDSEPARGQAPAAGSPRRAAQHGRSSQSPRQR